MVSGQSGLGVGAAALFLVAVGCSAADTQRLAGTWKGDGPVAMEITLNTNGTYESTVHSRVPIRTSGTWTYKSPRLNLKVEDVDIPNADGFITIPQEQKEKLIKKYGTLECAVSWKTDNQIVISGDPPLMGSFRRKKP
jgi:hypothetical protein